MWSTIKQFRRIKRLGNVHKELKRLFMSDSFTCNDVWTSRLKTPILQKVDIENLFYELDNKFAQAGRVSAIDIDIFVNALNDGEHLDEMEDLVHRLRITSESSNTLESTPHAFIRNFLKFGDADELMRILNDRLNYGIFPDKYCCIYLMDHFIKQGDFCKAAKVATLQMLQENFYDDLVKYLSLYSCHKYLLNPTIWQKPEEKQVENDEEEVKVRVKFLRNPFFDNHFDLNDSDDLIGKTLLMISDSIEQSIGTNYRFLGSILFNDKKTENYITDLSKNKNSLYLSTLELAEEIIESLVKKSKDVEGSSQRDYENLKNGIKLLKDGNNYIQGNLLDVVEDKIKGLVASNEKSIIEEQVQVYEDWEVKREDCLKNELDALNKKMILEEIKQKKEELKIKEDELFFFERENELDLAIENKRVRYPPKWLGKKKKKHIREDEYIPPEIVKQRN